MSWIQESEIEELKKENKRLREILGNETTTETAVVKLNLVERLNEELLGVYTMLEDKTFNAPINEVVEWEVDDMEVQFKIGKYHKYDDVFSVYGQWDGYENREYLYPKQLLELVNKYGIIQNDNKYTLNNLPNIFAFKLSPSSNQLFHCEIHGNCNIVYWYDENGEYDEVEDFTNQDVVDCLNKGSWIIDDIVMK